MKKLSQILILTLGLLGFTMSGCASKHGPYYGLFSKTVWLNPPVFTEPCRNYVPRAAKEWHKATGEDIMIIGTYGRGVLKGHVQGIARNKNKDVWFPLTVKKQSVRSVLLPDAPWFGSSGKLEINPDSVDFCVSLDEYEKGKRYMSDKCPFD